MKITVKQIGKIHAVLGQLGLAGDKEYKANLIKTYSYGRVSSTKDLTFDEGKRLISDLVGLVPQPDYERGAKMRKAIFAMAHRMRWEVPGANGEAKVDIERLNNWCVQSSYLHKKLDDYKYNELPKLVSQVEKVQSDFLKKI